MEERRGEGGVDVGRERWTDKEKQRLSMPTTSASY